jgi:hypothetical protein
VSEAIRCYTREELRDLASRTGLVVGEEVSFEGEAAPSSHSYVVELRRANARGGP